MYDAGWAGHRLAARVRRPRRHASWSSSSGTRSTRAPARPTSRPLFVGLNHAGPTLDRLRHRGAEGVPPAADPPRRRRLVPGLLRAERRLGPRRAADPRRHRRRRARGHRPEDLDELRRTSPSSRSCSCAPIPRRRKHKGITWVICPMDAPGIEIRPDHDAHRRRATSARSSTTRCASRSRNVVGKLNDGWRVAMATLSFERGTAFLSEQVRIARRVGRARRSWRVRCRGRAGRRAPSTTTRSRGGWRSPRPRSMRCAP